MYSENVVYLFSRVYIHIIYKYNGTHTLHGRQCEGRLNKSTELHIRPNIIIIIIIFITIIYIVDLISRKKNGNK